MKILIKLQNYIVQTKNEEICVEALRVLANLSRHKVHIKNIYNFK